MCICMYRVRCKPLYCFHDMICTIQYICICIIFQSQKRKRNIQMYDYLFYLLLGLMAKMKCSIIYFMHQRKFFMCTYGREYIFAIILFHIYLFIAFRYSSELLVKYLHVRPKRIFVGHRDAGKIFLSIHMSR